MCQGADRHLTRTPRERPTLRRRARAYFSQPSRGRWWCHAATRANGGCGSSALPEPHSRSHESTRATRSRCSSGRAGGRASSAGRGGEVRARRCSSCRTRRVGDFMVRAREGGRPSEASAMPSPKTSSRPRDHERPHPQPVWDGEPDHVVGISTEGPVPHLSLNRPGDLERRHYRR